MILPEKKTPDLPQTSGFEKRAIFVGKVCKRGVFQFGVLKHPYWDVLLVLRIKWISSPL